MLEGGSLAVDCLLCPVRQGAFRQTIDTHEWVHQVCPFPESSCLICNTNSFGLRTTTVGLVSVCWCQSVWCMLY